MFHGWNVPSQPPDLNEIALFVHVAKLGSLTAAAKALALPKSTVSRKLTQLEERLGARLVQRTPRHLSLTERGKIFFDHCSGLLEMLTNAEAAVADSERTPRGSLRISAGMDFGVAVVSPLIQEFLAAHPQVTIDLYLSDRTVDLMAEGFDVAIRIGVVRGAALLTRLLGKTSGMLCASPDYLAKNGTPKSADELEQHLCIVYNAPPHGNEWELRSEDDSRISVQVKTRLSVNSLAMVRDAAIAGLGIARLPMFMCSQPLSTRQLVRVLPRHSAVERPVYAVCVGKKFMPAKVRAFLDFFAERMPGALRGG
jgi:DNA-binding transcriptional LysR family regulator